MNLLELVQQVTAELGLFVPNTVIGNQAAETIQMLGMINGLGNELMRKYPWNQLYKTNLITTEYTTTNGTFTSGSASVTLSPAVTADTTYSVSGTYITNNVTLTSSTILTLSAVATVTGTYPITFSKTKYAMPSDFDRIVDKTEWDKTMHWQMLGPLTAQQWQYLQSGFISTGPRIRFRILGGTFQIFPPLATVETLGFEYLSNNWVYDTTITGKSSFTLDTDITIFPDRLMVLGLKLKYFETKGFDTTAIYRDYTEERDIAFANDGGSQTLSFSPGRSSNLISMNNVPDSGYGV